MRDARAIQSAPASASASASGPECNSVERDMGPRRDVLLSRSARSASYSNVSPIMDPMRIGKRAAAAAAATAAAGAGPGAAAAAAAGQEPVAADAHAPHVQVVSAYAGVGAGWRPARLLAIRPSHPSQQETAAAFHPPQQETAAAFHPPQQETAAAFHPPQQETAAAFHPPHQETAAAFHPRPVSPDKPRKRARTAELQDAKIEEGTFRPSKPPPPPPPSAVADVEMTSVNVRDRPTPPEIARKPMVPSEAARKPMVSNASEAATATATATVTATATAAPPPPPPPPPVPAPYPPAPAPPEKVGQTSVNDSEAMRPKPSPVPPRNFEQSGHEMTQDERLIFTSLSRVLVKKRDNDGWKCVLCRCVSANGCVAFFLISLMRIAVLNRQEKKSPTAIFGETTPIGVVTHHVKSIHPLFWKDLGNNGRDQTVPGGS